jgi:hypothetical protein
MRTRSLKSSSISKALAIAKHAKPLPPLVVRQKLRPRKAGGGGVDDWIKPPFDPSKPFKALDNGPPLRDALLNPELARKLLAKGPESGSKSRQIAIAQYLRRNSAAALFDQYSRSGN